MLDHVTLPVADLGRAKAFYDAAGYGTPKKAFFWIGASGASINGVHVAFTASDRATVESFHKAALEHGGRDNGKPGLRPHYHKNYYGAFVLDPDGHNIEAVCHHAT
jgi:catechol 2,3-dioxygenase-like lactoylglutathione lyase family enzyme